jgi:ammonium transporter, Amt family
MNTTLSAAAGVLAAAALTRAASAGPMLRFAPMDGPAAWWPAARPARGSRPPRPPSSGAVAGVLVTLSVEWLDLRRRVDDPAGAISVHAAGGLWGLLAVALFGPGPVAGTTGRRGALAAYSCCP